MPNGVRRSEGFISITNSGSLLRLRYRGHPKVKIITLANVRRAKGTISITRVRLIMLRLNATTNRCRCVLERHLNGLLMMITTLRSTVTTARRRGLTSNSTLRYLCCLIYRNGSLNVHGATSSLTYLCLPE